MHALSHLSAMPASLVDEWTQQAVFVALAHSRSWMAIAGQAIEQHRALAAQAPCNPAHIFLQIRHTSAMRRLLAVAVESRAQVSQALRGLTPSCLALDTHAQREAVDLACAELDTYIAQAQACDSRPV